MIETVQERVRNMVGPFYNIAQLLRNIDNKNINEYLIKYASDISETMFFSIDYLIDMSKIIDENLPDGFDINKLLDKTKYHKIYESI